MRIEMIRMLLVLLLLVLWVRPTDAAFTLDTSGEMTGTSTSDPVTYAYTCGATAKLIVLYISIGVTTARTGGNPTYNGRTMEFVAVQAAAGETGNEMWYLSNPDTGSAYNFSVPNAGGLSLDLMAVSFITPQRGAGLDMVTRSGTTAANPSLSITPMQDNTVIVNAFSSGNNTIPSGNDQTLLFSRDNGNFTMNSQYAFQTTKTSITFTWTENSDDVANILAVFREAVGSVVQGDSLILGDSVINGL